MDEDNQEEPEGSEEVEVTDQQIRRMKNLKMFKDWTDEAVRDYIKNRPKKEGAPKLFTPESPKEAEDIEYDEAEYQKQFSHYLKKYHKEYGVDMNDANDAQALQALVRFILQAEYADQSTRKLQRIKNVDSRTLKNMGDFQRSIQQSITELQDRLGISRKMRKEKQVDDIPQYIRSLQTRAQDFWKRQTIAVTCNKCQIELARYWLNFPDRVDVAHFEITCEKCREKVVYSQ